MERAALISRFREGSAAIEQAVDRLTEDDLDRLGPDGGWTPRQVVHHLADSEATAYVRLRKLIAEDEAIIQAYDEPEFARRLHYDRPIGTSFAVLQAVRAASLELLESLTPAEWERQGTHAESGAYPVDDWLRIYAGHSLDHANQIHEAVRSTR
ncbi:MAG: DinB family protein [Chloroflexi bacterium]|nr:DinB family protein [Chloroflexota bacterium]